MTTITVNERAEAPVSTYQAIVPHMGVDFVVEVHAAWFYRLRAAGGWMHKEGHEVGSMEEAKRLAIECLRGLSAEDVARLGEPR